MGASGSGKSAIQHSLPIDFMTNCTTRVLRDGEIDGYHIKQVSEEEFLKLDSEEYFFETTKYAGNYYGTPKYRIDEMLNGKPYHCTKDINGAMELKNQLGSKAVVIYIKPPSIIELQKRMSNRGDSIEDIERRIKHLQETNEIDNEKYADYVIVNDDLKEAQLEAHKIVINEFLRINN
jgi:guanylate kinase